MGSRGPESAVDCNFVREQWGKMSLQNMGDKFGVSRQRIYQIGREMGLPKLKDAGKTNAPSS